MDSENNKTVKTQQLIGLQNDILDQYNVEKVSRKEMTKEKLEKNRICNRV